MAAPPSTSQPTFLRTSKLVATVSNSATVLVDRFSDILEIAGPGNKDKYITAAETYQLDVHASAMVRAAEELLNVTRKLKQLWILSEAKEEAEGDNKVEVGDVAKELERILRQTESGEEMDGIEQDKPEEQDNIEID